jgi:hypothetical protein
LLSSWSENSQVLMVFSAMTVYTPTILRLPPLFNMRKWDHF